MDIIFWLQVYIGRQNNASDAGTVATAARNFLHPTELQLIHNPSQHLPSPTQFLQANSACRLQELIITQLATMRYRASEKVVYGLQLP